MIASIVDVGVCLFMCVLVPLMIVFVGIKIVLAKKAKFKRMEHEAQEEIKAREARKQRFKTLLTSNPLKVVIRRPDKRKTPFESLLIQELINLGARVVCLDDDSAETLISPKKPQCESDVPNVLALTGFDLTKDDQVDNNLYNVDVRLIRCYEGESVILYSTASYYTTDYVYNRNATNLSALAEDVVETILDNCS